VLPNILHRHRGNGGNRLPGTILIGFSRPCPIEAYQSLTREGANTRRPHVTYFAVRDWSNGTCLLYTWPN